MNVTPIILHFTTRHYKFKLTLRESVHPLHTFTFLVGDKDKPCLEGNINLENRTGNSRFDSMTNTAKLIKIDALQECSLDDITEEYMATYSFGTELLESIIFFINSQFPSIMTVSLNDASYIPCIRESKDTLDLLIYSIALYKKTWYEQKINAYIKPQEKYDEYRKQVDIYGSKDRKNSMEFSDIYKLIINGSSFTKDIFDKSYTEFEKSFDTSETLPEFFKELSKKIDRTQKCRFFKDWLEEFIGSQIKIERTWYFDIFPKIERTPDITKNTTRKRGGAKKWRGNY